jgi:hypothetical protein
MRVPSWSTNRPVLADAPFPTFLSKTSHEHGRFYFARVRDCPQKQEDLRGIELFVEVLMFVRSFNSGHARSIELGIVPTTRKRSLTVNELTNWSPSNMLTLQR